MPGALLDTHAFYWLVREPVLLTNEAQVAITKTQETRTLFVSPITAWELSLAARKPAHKDRPDLGDEGPAHWFREAVRATTAKIIPINLRIAIEAAEIITVTGHKDPGDCYLIATARVRKIPLITRDAVIRRIADERPGYFGVIVC